ncbi:MAG: DUF5723 family protein [Prevotellaceae bacterium]|nr:DUF5723 family protein [Prevotellaceae bacterium]MDY6200003.1 DUF5723 family protein [Prevotella sp.]
MKYINKYMALGLLSICSLHAKAQQLNSAYFTNDYKFRHTMNPAYGNEQNYVSMPGFGNVNVSLMGNFGYEDVIFDNPMFPSTSKDRLTTFMNPYISTPDALKGFNSGDNKILGDVSITVLSAGFKGFGGYNTIELNARTSFGMSLPYELFEFAKNTGNRTYNIGNISANGQAFAELAFGHSRQINEKLRVGAKVKLLFGAGRGDVNIDNVKADLAADDKWTVSGHAKSEVSVKGFTYKTEEKEYKEEGRGTYQYVNDVDVDGAGLGGFGLAFDLGGVYKINNDFTVSAALLDLGFIKWSNNMVAVNGGEEFVFNGFHDVAVNEDHGGSTMSMQGDKYSDQLADFANLQDKGDEGGRTTGIGATLNLGCEYTLPVYRKITFGVLSSTRFRGDYSWTEARVSANWTPLKWIDGGVNMAFGSYRNSFGWVVNFHPKGYNFYVGMDHTLGKVSKEFIPLNSNAAVSVGMSVAW